MKNNNAKPESKLDKYELLFKNKTNIVSPPHK